MESCVLSCRYWESMSQICSDAWCAIAASRPAQITEPTSGTPYTGVTYGEPSLSVNIGKTAMYVEMFISYFWGQDLYT